jgi:predicted nucleic acid-binding protein
MKNDIKKYSKIHDEVIKRVQSNEITAECAKEINDLAFQKYIVESTVHMEHIDELQKLLLKMSENESEPLFNPDILKDNSYMTETFYGGNKYLEEIESCFESLKPKIFRNPKGSDEIKAIENNLSKLFGFENAYFTI